MWTDLHIEDFCLSLKGFQLRNNHLFLVMKEIEMNSSRINELESLLRGIKTQYCYHICLHDSTYDILL